MSVTVYTLPNCSQCEATKRLLDKKGVSYTVADLDGDKLAEFKARGHRQAPIVITSDGQEWSGLRRDLIETLTVEGDSENPWNF